MDKQDIYLELYREWRDHVRHHETQRSTITGVCLALTGASISLVHKTMTEPPSSNTFWPLIWLGLTLIVFGTAAYIINQKHYERIMSALENADLLLEATDSLMAKLSPKIEGPSIQSGPHLVEMRKWALTTHTARFKHLPEVRLHYLWSGLPMLVALAGVGVFFWALSSNAAGHHWMFCAALTFALIISLAGIWATNLRSKVAKMTEPRPRKLPNRTFKDFLESTPLPTGQSKASPIE